MCDASFVDFYGAHARTELACDARHEKVLAGAGNIQDSSAVAGDSTANFLRQLALMQPPFQMPAYQPQITASPCNDKLQQAQKEGSWMSGGFEIPLVAEPASPEEVAAMIAMVDDETDIVQLQMCPSTTQRAAGESGSADREVLSC